MKQLTLFFLTLSFLFSFGSCSSDDDTNIDSNDKIPVEIRKDIESRFSKSEIKYSSTSGEQISIHLLDESNNEADLIYKNNNFESESKLISLEVLPEKVQTAFSNVKPNGTINDLIIYRIQRSYLKQDLYIFKFLETTNKYNNLVHNAFINEDGTLLYKLNYNVNDFVMLYPNSVEEFEFVKKNYIGADIRCQLNEAGEPLLIIIHEGYTKYVLFRSTYDTIDGKYKSTWKNTRYQLPFDYPVPANVLASLKKEDPNFVYTKITKVEGPDFESYMFTDETREDRLGYTVPDKK